MIACKYFQQGNCRFGQYCKFDHSFGNRTTKNFNNDVDKNVAILVAQEVIAAEKGGQWLLSCYGPFKEKKCIPGMDDVSPEEVRLEMYQAQKNNTVNQVNVQFQQMCEQMKAKHEALKNPTPQLFQLLESIQNPGTENKGNFPYSTSQLATNTQTNNVFGQKSFGAPSNPFGTTNSTFNATQTSSSIFGRTTNSTSSVFGNKPSFGSPSVFGSTPAVGNSVFGGATKTATTPFGGVQNAQTFGGLASQGTNNPMFSSSNQSTFGQPSGFGANNSQVTSSFIKPQSSVFGTTSSPSNVFGGSTSTSGTSLFGGGTTTAVSNANSGSVFGAQSTTGSAAFGSTASTVTPNVTSSIFGGSATGTSAFGAAPVFGGSANFQRSGTSVFGSQPVFGGGTTATNTVSSTTNIFGSGTNTGVSAFGGTSNAFGGANTNLGTNVFGSSVANTFEAPPNSAPFGATISAASPFNSATQPAFATAASTAPAFGGSNSTPFSQSSSFGFATSTSNASTNVFGSAPAQPQTIASKTFGDIQQQTNSSVFGISNSTASNNSNPFIKSSPFGTASSMQSSPFGNFSKGGIGLSVAVSIDETGYSLDNCLTDDEKAIYQMAQFPEGQIPLKPPTKELS